MSIAAAPELQALQASLQDWAKRHSCLPAVRAAEQAGASADLSVFDIIDPADAAASVLVAATAAEQLAADLVPGQVMPTLLAALLLQPAQSAATPVPVAVALNVGGLTAIRQPDGTFRVTGETGPVLGASAATTLLLAGTDTSTPAGSGMPAAPGTSGAADAPAASGMSAGFGTDIWFTLAPATLGVTVSPLVPLDFSRPLARVRLDDVAVSPVDGLSTQRVRDLTATLFAAEASGVAAWCSQTATEYAKTRKQFGRLISEFQSVKHLCAFMYCRAERAAALAWDAARAADEAPERLGAAASAAVRALDDAVQNAKDCIQVLGGIGFTWEHDAHLYLRRALALRALLGGIDAWPAPPPAPVKQEAPAADRKAPGADIGIGAWAAPAIHLHGTPAQQERFIGPTMNAEIRWCQLFSEPEAGSDLAGLRTKAVRVDGGWQLTGQKVWTSLARQADWAICLARTDPDVPKHKGLSYFLVDMHSDGIEVRPLREITGRSVFNEVFLDDVFVADDCLVGAPGDGWQVAMSTLATERESIAGDDILAIRGAHPAVRKLIGVEARQSAAEAAFTALGADGAAVGPEGQEFLLTRCLSIAGGTTQVLLNQVAERILGLPRDPAPRT